MQVKFWKLNYIKPKRICCLVGRKADHNSAKNVSKKQNFLVKTVEGKTTTKIIHKVQNTKQRTARQIFN